MRAKWTALLAATAIGTALFAGGAAVLAQDKPVGNLRIAKDETGTPLESVEAAPGEKLFHFDKGPEKLLIAYDFEGSSPTDVQIRVMGMMGSILMQESYKIDTPGTQVVPFSRRGLALDDGEYVVNAYVGPDLYLADSLQVTIGKAEIAQSVLTQTPNAAVPTMRVLDAGGTPPPPPAPGADNPAQPAAPSAPASVPGTSRGMLALAGLGMLALLGVVIWAGWSATRRS